MNTLDVQWVTVKRVAPALDMTEPQVYRAIREGVFPFRFVRIGKQIRIHAGDVFASPAHQQLNKVSVRAEAA